MVAGGDVRQKPNCFFVDFVFAVAQKGSEEAQRTVVEHDLINSSDEKAIYYYLSLLVSTSDDVSNGAQGSSLKFDFWVAEQKHQL